MFKMTKYLSEKMKSMQDLPQIGEHDDDAEDGDMDRGRAASQEKKKKKRQAPNGDDKEEEEEAHRMVRTHTSHTHTHTHTSPLSTPHSSFFFNQYLSIRFDCIIENNILLVKRSSSFSLLIMFYVSFCARYQSIQVKKHKKDKSAAKKLKKEMEKGGEGKVKVKKTRQKTEKSIAAAENNAFNKPWKLSPGRLVGRLVCLFVCLDLYIWFGLLEGANLVIYFCVAISEILIC